MFENAPSITDWIGAAVAVALVVLSALAWRLNKRLAWLTGALESGFWRQLPAWFSGD